MLAALLLPSCAAPPAPSPAPGLPVPPAFSATGGAEVPDRWWRALGDPVLERLVDEGLHGSFTLRAAWERLAQADAVARREGAARSVLVDAGADATVLERSIVTTGIGRERHVRESRNRVSLGVAASYEADLWGRIDSAAAAASLDARARAEDLQAAALTLSARIADAWVRLVEQWALEALLREQMETDGRILDLVETRFRLGRVPSEDVLRQRQLAEAKREEAARARREAGTVAVELCLLLGRSPGTPPAPRTTELPALPPLPATGAPADLLRRRPDVRAALLAVRAADARTAAAALDRYPRVRLTADLGTDGPTTRQAFEGWAFNLVAGLTAPLLDGGRRAAEEERAAAAAREAVETLGQVMLEALGEVESALGRERRQEELLGSLEKQRSLSEEIVRSARDRYLGGAGDYLRVLEALSTSQGLERRLLAARRVLVQDRIDLYRALAGGWSREPSAGDEAATAEPSR